MISNHIKKEYLQEIDVLIYAMRLSIENGIDQTENLEKAQQLKSYIQGENDITLEETMNVSVELNVNTDTEQDIKIKLERLKQTIPEEYIRLANAKSKYEEILPEWLKIALIEHPEWQEKTLRLLGSIATDNDYSILIKAIPELFEFLPRQNKIGQQVLCQEVVKRNPELLKFVPIDIIEKDIEFWKTYFNINGIDIELFIQYDSQIRKNIDDKTKSQKEPIELLIEAQKNGNVENLPEEIKERFPKVRGVQSKTAEEKKKELTEEEIKNYVDMVNEGRTWFVKKLPVSFLIENFEWCKQLCKVDSEAFRDMPEEVKLANPEWAMEFWESNFYYIPEQIKLDNPEWAKQIAEKNTIFFRLIPEQIILDNIEWSISLAQKNREYFEALPEKIKLLNPELCKKIAEQDKNTNYRFSILQSKFMPNQIKLSNPRWYKELTLKQFKNNFNRDSLTDEQVLEEATRNIEQMQNEYISRYYSYGELNFEELRKSCPEKVNEDKVLQTYQERIPIMKNICQGIINLDPNIKREYFSRADEVAKRYLELSSNGENIESIIGEISRLELDVQTKELEYKEKQKSEQAYGKMKNDIMEKISRIEKINPELAQKYREQLEENNERNIEYRTVTGMPSEEEIKLSNEIDFFISANFQEEKSTDMVIYKPKKKGFWTKIFEKITGKNKEEENVIVEATEEITKEIEIDEEPEPPEFANMSLDELKRKAQALEKLIETRQNQRGERE